MESRNMLYWWFLEDPVDGKYESSLESSSHQRGEKKVLKAPTRL